MKIPREVAISSPRSGGEAVVGAVKQLSNDSENLTRRHTGETLGLAAIPPPFQLLAVGALPGRPYDRSAMLSYCSAMLSCPSWMRSEQILRSVSLLQIPRDLRSQFPLRKYPTQLGQIGDDGDATRFCVISAI